MGRLSYKFDIRQSYYVLVVSYATSAYVKLSEYSACCFWGTLGGARGSLDCVSSLGTGL